MAERPGRSEISGYARECLREDEEFILYRAHANTAEVPSILLLTPASMRPRLESLKKIEHEYSLRRDFDSAWAVRPIALSRGNRREALVLDDLVVSFSIGAPMETRQFLRIAVGLSSAFCQLHKQSLVHKDPKPSSVLVDKATGDAWKATGDAWLAGFGIASRLPRRAPAARGSRVHRWTPALHGARTDRTDESFHRFAQRPLWFRPVPLWMFSQLRSARQNRHHAP
jgi:serine/threonine protein kinase